MVVTSKLVVPPRANPGGRVPAALEQGETLPWTNIRRETVLPPRHNQQLTHKNDSLVHFVDSYRDPNGENDGHESILDEEPGAKKPWWAFWRKGNSGKARFSDFETPSDWLNTDLRDGLVDAEVDRRRKRSGWNELTTEKENMLLKFIGFFRGPILYGRLPWPWAPGHNADNEQ